MIKAGQLPMPHLQAALWEMYPLMALKISFFSNDPSLTFKALAAGKKPLMINGNAILQEIANFWPVKRHIWYVVDV